MNTWNPPRKYKGFRTNLVHAIKITIPRPEYVSGRSMSAMDQRGSYTEKLYEMEEWCEDHCTRNWSSMGYTTWYFDRMPEAIMFKMLFGGK